MLAARGSLLLFADADGATPIEEERRLSAAIEAGADVAVGSRLLAAEGLVRHRTWGRSLIGSSFASVARAAIGLPVRDTQCGFKMFRPDAGKRIFADIQETGYLFDIELLFRARQLGYRVVEVPINWSDVPGSRLKISREFWRIGAGLWRLRRRLIRLNDLA
jgi:dolichyl-phosphate beta-glucosyltransferase